ncbi:MAG: TolC family protein, partial [bacterium]|nr:TolC family protein [bacterium]
LEKNLALRQREISLKESLQALKEARGMFLPTVSIEARYSRAGGGRNIEMPIGDLVNPLHTTLNQLLSMHGQNPVFPADIVNEQIPFLRKKEHDTKLRIIQPVFQPGIYYNFKIKKELTAMEKAKIRVFKRQLVSDIKTAYFNYLKAGEVKKLLKNTRGLLEENLHLNRSLFKNHKRTEEVVFRAEAELSQLDQQYEEARKNLRLATSYFNFLLDSPLDTPIDTPPGTGTANGSKLHFKEYQLEQLTASALNQRQEFKQLQGALKAAAHSTSLHKASVLPTVSAVFDYGFQGEKYKFSGKDDYWMGSLALSWNLFKGGRDKALKKQSIYRRQKLETRQLELQNQIRLQVREAHYNLEVAEKTVTTTAHMLKSRKETFSIVSKKYTQGMVPQIEYMKARNDLTGAGVNFIVAVYDYYTREAQLERASASYAFTGVLK